MSIAQLVLFVLPLGLDTLGVSLSLGMKSDRDESKSRFPSWLRSACLFSTAEMLMPVVGLIIGFAASLVVSGIMHYVGAGLLVGVGLWELLEEGREYLDKRKNRAAKTHKAEAVSPRSQPASFEWGRQLLLALSISLDELAIGFSLGSVTTSSRAIAISPLALCLLIGIQGFLMAVIGLSLGRGLRTRLKPLQEWSELLGAVLLIGLGIWLLVS